jgi:MFS family permease
MECRISLSLEPPPVSEVDKPSPEEASHTEYAYSVFTAAMRTYLTYLLGFIIIISTLTATIYFPLIPMLSTRFSVSIEAINLTVTVYAICQAISPALFASLADALGRRPVLLALISLYACASLGLALNKKSYVALVALRAVQSIGGSATPPIAYGIVADVAPASERGKMLGPMLSTCNAISAIGPVIGGAVALTTGGYTWVFLALFIIAIIFLLLTGFTLPETSRNVVGNGTRSTHAVWRTWWSYLPRKSQQQQKQRNDIDQGETKAKVKEKPRWQVLSAFTSLRIILYPDAAAVLWMVATSYSVYYTFQVAIPVIYKDIYGYNELLIGLAFLPGLAGMTVGGIIAGKLIDMNYAEIARRHSISPFPSSSREKPHDFPLETARYHNIIPFIFFEVSLVIGYGWSIHPYVHPAVPLVLQFFICSTSTLLTHTASALLVDIFPDKSSTAYASGQVMRCGISAASAAVLQPLVNAMGRGWYFTFLGVFVGVIGVVSVSVSRVKGMHWRQKRQDGRADVEQVIILPEALLAPILDEESVRGNTIATA